MCQHSHDPIHCIIPPYMRMKLLEQANNKPALFKSHIGNFSMDEIIRSRRQTFSKLSAKGKSVLADLQIGKPGNNNLFKRTSGIVTNPRPSREVYSAKNKDKLPGILIRSEGAAPGRDADVNRVFDFAGATFDFYQSVFGRNSIDGAGMKIIQTVHYMQQYDNAFWDGKQMIYGDGDSKIFASFTSDADITGHELTHGVIQFECNLEYKDQSGALNESLADVFGIMIKQKLYNEDVKSSSWLIGENTLLGDQYAIRSMKAPGKAYINHPYLGSDPQPANMSGYRNDPNDNGVVHLNSGIPNHAFYLAAIAIGGFAWEKLGLVWYNVLCNGLKSNATFSDFKLAAVAEAAKLFGKTSIVVKAIADAWSEVGV